MTVTIMIGDVREQLRKIDSDSIHCCVTSPPYWGLRDYGVDGQIGLESSPAEFIAVMVDVFEEVRRVLRPDGTCWINMGDSYAANRGSGSSGIGAKQATNVGANLGKLSVPDGLKPKDLCMMPHRLAIALQDAGWWVRQDIVWSKPNPMPESVTDRCTKSHEYIFLLTKSAKYFYDAGAIREPAKEWTGQSATFSRSGPVSEHILPGQSAAQHRPRLPGNVNPAKGQAAFEAGDEMHRTKSGLLAYAQKQRAAARGVGFGHGTDAQERGRGRVTLRDTSRRENSKRAEVFPGQTMGAHRPDRADTIPDGYRNKRSVWNMATHSFSEAHFATFPPELPETCIKAGCPEGGTVLDPFFGAGTTGLVADRLQRDCIGIELNQVYAEMARKRIQKDSTLFSEIRMEEA